MTATMNDVRTALAERSDTAGLQAFDTVVKFAADRCADEPFNDKDQDQLLAALDDLNSRRRPDEPAWDIDRVEAMIEAQRSFSAEGEPTDEEIGAEIDLVCTQSVVTTQRIVAAREELRLAEISQRMESSALGMARARRRVLRDFKQCNSALFATTPEEKRAALHTTIPPMTWREVERLGNQGGLPAFHHTLPSPNPLAMLLRPESAKRAG